MKCPNCHGAKMVKTCWGTQAGPHGDVDLCAMMKCRVCWGKGWVTQKQADQHESERKKGGAR